MKEGESLTGSTLVRNIGELVTNSGSGPYRNANFAFAYENSVITWVGPESQSPKNCENIIDATGAAILPGFVDSHSHLIFAGQRSAEFAARMAGESYAAGGIRSTVAATRAATDAELRNNCAALVDEFHGAGITTFEIKSGYGLDVESEVRSLRIAREFTPETTFLGAHVVPTEFSGNTDAYVDLVCGEMLKAALPYARWIDVFCDRGAFTPEQARKILHAGMDAGLLVKLHANQIESIGGIEVACELGAVSVDHLTYTSDSELALLAEAGIVATLLPGVEFSTRSPYPDARRFIDAGVELALATDCNPGSSFTTSMQLVIALAVREMHFTVDQAVLAATLGGAKALARTDIGAIAVGMSADFVILTAPSIDFLAYRPGVPQIAHTYKAGKALTT
jgi:imidazolonepropionase